MALPSHDRVWTLEDLEAMPDDGFLHELQAGLLLSEPLPSPRHGRVAMRIGYRLEEYVRRHGRGVVISNDAAFVLARNPDTVRGPDETRTITTQASLSAPVVHGELDRLRAEDLLPGFELRVGEVFEI